MCQADAHDAALTKFNPSSSLLTSCASIRFGLQEDTNPDIALQGSRSGPLGTAAPITRNTSSLFNKRAGFCCVVVLD